MATCTSQTPPRPVRRGRGGGLVARLRRLGWMGASLLLHLLALAWLTLVPVVREVRAALRERRPEEGLSAETLDAAARKLREINRANIERRVAELEDIARQMEETRKRRDERLAEEVRNEPSEALDRARRLAAEILALQEAIPPDQAVPQTALEDTTRALAETLALPGTEGLVRLNAELAAVRSGIEPQQTPLNTLAGRMSDVLSRQVALAEAVAWLDQPSLMETVAAAQTAQQRAADQTRAAAGRVGPFRQIAEWDLPGDLRRSVEILDNPDGWAVDTRARAAEKAQRLLDQGAAMAADTVAAAEAQARSITTMRELAQALADTSTEPFELSGSVAEAQAVALDALDIPALYAHGVATEARIVEHFQEIRAAELTLLTGLAPSRAREMTALDAPERPPLDARSFRDGIQHADDYTRHDAQLRTVLAETETMLAKATELLVAARRFDEQEAQGTDVALDFAEQQAQARDNFGTRDVPQPEVPATEGDEAEQASSHGNWLYGGRRTGDAGIRIPSLPARGVESDGTPGLWFHLASWQTLGPFTTGQGADVARRYAPEQRIDLDAVYKGPDGRSLAWRYVNAPGSVVAFPEQADQAVYYATAELRFEEAGAFWVAVASDDRAELWINGEIAWIGEYFSDHDRPLWPFPIAEHAGTRPVYFNHFGFRKVAFREGVNRLLLRVENGGGGCGFSLLVATRDPQAEGTP